MKKKRCWLKEEETEFLTLLHFQNKFPEWKKISQALKTKNIHKTSLQCYKKWYNNKNLKSYKVNFPEPKKIFNKQQEKKLLKLSLEYAPFWKKISKHFIDKNRFDISNHFYGIVRKGLGKACKLIGKNITNKILWRIKPKLYSLLISKDIKIDFKEFKESEFGKLEKNCEDFSFVNFYDFVCKFYFNDFEEIWENVSEREIFIIKKVIIYVIGINIKYNRNTKMTKKKQKDFLKKEKFFLEQQNNIFKLLSKSFYEKNISVIELPFEKEQREIEEKNIILKQNYLKFMNPRIIKSELYIRKIFVVKNPLLFYKSRNKKNLKLTNQNLNEKKEKNVFFNFREKSNNKFVKNLNFFMNLIPKNKNDICINNNRLIISKKIE